MDTEKVYAIWDYYDGIRTGFADFRGAPHYFEAAWNEQNEEYSSTFTLRVINQKTLDLVLENWRIFRNWELQFHNGKIPPNTHPGLPGQNARYAELDSQIRRIIESSVVTASGVEGTFSAIEGQGALPPGVFREVRVTWRMSPVPQAAKQI